MVFSVVTLVVTGWLFTIVKKGFFPSEDQGLLRANTEGAQGIGFDDMKEKMLAIAAIAREGSRRSAPRATPWRAATAARARP